MKDDPFRPLIFAVGLLIGVGAMYVSTRSDLLDQDKIISKLEDEVKVKPVITVEGLGICQVQQGGKVYMLVDITTEMQATDSEAEMGLEEKHQQLMENYDQK